jgi:EAL domain-containing protein (putative c-di-GMP-specific phosphodiesterase class I)
MLGRRKDRRTVPARALVERWDELQIVFQPICDLGTGEPVGYEALSRFPEGRPDECFAAAHALGEGLELEMRAVSEAVSLGDDAWPYLSVNVSPMALASADFVKFILAIPEPRRLVLELTEHTAVGDYDALSAALKELRDGGLRIAVDDAGGGVSSFRHILMVAPEIIKLDRSLIADLDKDPGRQALAELLVQFADRMGAELVAEGIERGEERDACHRHGIAYGQGYLLGRPSAVPANDPGA